ncbi:MAG TPA: SAM-dependent methyltransferase, partial [Kineosporiaceae bacterium]
MTDLVTVIGVGGPGPGDALAGARLALGAAAHLDTAPLPTGCERVVLGPLAPALARLRAASRDGVPAVVLASGDPGFFGIVRRLRSEGFEPTVVPAPSSVAVAFARLGL